MADQTNPYTQLGMMGMMMPNPYTQYKGQLPMPGYMGTPTDAEGSPIQSFTDAQAQHDAWDKANPAPAAGTTLNSTPAGLEAQGSQARAMQNAGYGDWSQLDPTMAASNRPNPTAGAGSVGATAGWNPANPMSAYPTTAGGAAGAAGGGSATAAQPPQNPIDMRQAYLTALSNPGKPSMPGANVPQAQPLGTPSVLNSFLAAHPSGGTAAPAGGGYGNKGFFDTLNQLRSA